MGMAARSIGSTTISLGLVAIPVKLYSTVKEGGGASFNLLHAECGTRVKQQLVCPTHDCAVEFEETVKGFEVAPGHYARFTAQELAALEAAQRDELIVEAFVPAGELDALRVNKSNFLGPDKGGQKSYQLLLQTMRDANLVAVCRYNTKGKSLPAMLSAYDAVLVLHRLYFDSEILSYSDIDLGGSPALDKVERGLARDLVAGLRRDAFDGSTFRDEYFDRVRAAADVKAAGGEITKSPEQPTAHVVDLVEALKRSVAENAPKSLKGGVRKAASEKPPRRRRAS